MLIARASFSRRNFDADPKPSELTMTRVKLHESVMEARTRMSVQFIGMSCGKK